jgi:hypothetical protein
MVAHFKGREVAGDLAVNVRVLRGLRAWKLSHGQGTEKSYTDWVNARGMR